jgi:hypothetical protein
MKYTKGGLKVFLRDLTCTARRRKCCALRVKAFLPQVGLSELGECFLSPNSSQEKNYSWFSQSQNLNANAVRFARSECREKNSRSFAFFAQFALKPCRKIQISRSIRREKANQRFSNHG